MGPYVEGMGVMDKSLKTMLKLVHAKRSEEYIRRNRHG